MASCKVEFDIMINSLAPNYASHPITFGDLSDGSKWVFSVFVAGHSYFHPNDDNTSGQLYICGNTVNGKGVTRLSPKSDPLDLKKKYHIKWTYDQLNGGCLYIDNHFIDGNIDYIDELDIKLSKNINLKTNMYHGVGRQRTMFDGEVMNVELAINGNYYENVTDGNIDKMSPVPLNGKLPFDINEETDKLLDDMEPAEIRRLSEVINKPELDVLSDVTPPGTDNECDDEYNPDSKVTPEKEEEFDPNFIKQLFENINIPSKYVVAFNEEEISRKSMLLLNDNDLYELGLKMGPRKILRNYINSQYASPGDTV